MAPTDNKKIKKDMPSDDSKGPDYSPMPAGTGTDVNPEPKPSDEGYLPKSDVPDTKAEKAPKKTKSKKESKPKKKDLPKAEKKSGNSKSPSLEERVSDNGDKAAGRDDFLDSPKITDEIDRVFTEERRMYGLLTLYINGYSKGDFFKSSYIKYALLGIETEGLDEENAPTFLKDYIDNKLLDDLLESKVGRNCVRSMGEVKLYGNRLGEGLNLQNPNKEGTKALLSKFALIARAYAEITETPFILDYFIKDGKK